MATYRVNSFEELIKLMEKHAKEREQRIHDAIVFTLHQALIYVASKTLPIAFGNIEKSLHVVPGQNVSSLIADAPHAEAVENGARPHTPPFAPILAWVRLRGAQSGALKGRVNPSGLRGSSSMRQARKVGGMLSRSLRSRNERMMKSFGVKKNVITRENTLHKMFSLINDDDFVKSARAIVLSIAKHGTPPHKYMLACLPYAMKMLDRNIRKALKDPQ